jgi:tetratricopeptide (TPR) repeat protein
MMIDRNILLGIYNLLNQEKFNEARKQVKLEISKSKDLTSFLELYGLLIDIGCESQTQSDLQLAIDFLEKQEEKILSTITKSSHYYNLANAKHGLAKIYISENKGVPKLEVINNYLQAPIDLYWMALKNLESIEDQLAMQILINLSNSLVDVGRLVEASQFLDQVLKINPNFPQALVSLGDLLDWISQVTNCSVSTALYYEIYSCYNEAIRTNTLPPSIQAKCQNGLIKAGETIEAHGFDLHNIESEKRETHKEFQAHTEFRKFCIENFLTLNEHAIYCNCVSTETDDLRIGVSHGRFKGQMVPKLELLLNRMKSEFGMARWLFFNRLTDHNLSFDTKYSELLDGEMIDPNTELLRTSFRVCYGILDKIALGICKLFDVTKEGENILFESFWKSKKERWDKLNQIRNPHLSALYSIACNLSTRGGELKEFKEWRNKLEHKVLILKNTETFESNILKVYEDKDFIAVIDFSEFEGKAMHLMQLTRAAIFSFVYCVRLQTIEESQDGSGFPIGFKE